MQRPNHRIQCSLAGIVLAMAASCAQQTATTASTTSAKRPTTSEPGATPITVTITTGRFQGMPTEIPVGTRVKLTNPTQELHEFLAFRLAPSESRSAAELVALTEDELLAVLGDGIPEVVLAAAPRTSSDPGFGDDRFERPGRYLVMCAVPVGADAVTLLASDRYLTGRWPDEYRGRPTHASLGEAMEVTVVETPGP